MEEKITQLIQKIYKEYDLGSEPSMDVVIYNKKAWLTIYPSKILIIFTEDLGHHIAEHIMLSGLSTPNGYGSFIVEPSLQTLGEIEKWGKDDIEFNLDLAKFWEVCRMVSNRSDKFENKAVYVHYDSAGGFFYKVLDTVEEFNEFVNNTFKFSEEE